MYLLGEVVLIHPRGICSIYHNNSIPRPHTGSGRLRAVCDHGRVDSLHELYSDGREPVIVSPVGRIGTKKHRFLAQVELNNELLQEIGAQQSLFVR
jgi:hypothetical protein